MEVNKEMLYKYIEHLIGIPINDNTLFFKDTGIDGFDAEIFMMNIRDKYEIDISSYDPYKYHYPDTEVVIGNFFKFIYNLLFDRSKLKKKDFSALHLYEVVKAGKWFDPD